MLYNQPFDKPPETIYGDTPYVNGNPSTGQSGSIPSAASIEYPQREIVNLIKDAGLVTPSNSDLHQLARSVQSQLMISDDDAGTANAYQVTMTPNPGLYYKYLTVIAKIGNTNTGPSVLNCNALGPKPIVHVDGSPLSANELKQGGIGCFIFDGTNFQMVWAGSTIVAAGPGGGGGNPLVLTASIDLYVNIATGNDTTMDGFSATVVGGTIHGPFKTLQRAADEAKKYNLNGYDLTVHVANGTYSAVSIFLPVGAGRTIWVGNVPNPANVLITPPANTTAMSIQNTGICIVGGFKFTSSGGSVNDAAFGVNISGSNVSLHDVEFGACGGSSMASTRGAHLTLYGSIVISGGVTGNAWEPACFIACYYNAAVETYPAGNPLNFTCTTAVNVGRFVWSNQSSSINLTWTSFTGFANISGTRYFADLNGVISSGGGGVNYYPGTIAGSTATGGQYA